MFNQTIHEMPHVNMMNDCENQFEMVPQAQDSLPMMSVQGSNSVVHVVDAGGVRMTTIQTYSPHMTTCIHVVQVC